MACGAWPVGPTPTTTSRSARCRQRSIVAATSSTPLTLTAMVAAKIFLGQIVRSNPGKRLYTATKIPPKNLQWPALPESTLMESYPPDHVEEYVHRSLENAGLEQFDLMQFHTWNDEWMRDDRWFYDSTTCAVRN